jgi:flagellar hook-associated protein 3 FlgL
MSGAIGSSYGRLDRLLSGLGSLQSQYSTLQQQTTTGKVADSYSGLGAAAGQAISLQTATSRTDAYTQTIAAVQGKAAVQQAALTQINSVVSALAAKALTLSGSNAPGAVYSVANEAKQALAQVASLLNTKDGDIYVFAGADTSNAPVPLPDQVLTSGLYTQIGTQVASLAALVPPAASTVIANTLNIAKDLTAGTTIFSSYLTGPGATAPAGTVEIADGQRVSLDVSANRNAGVISDSAIKGTGSAVNDILRSLSVIANSSDAVAASPGFAALIKDASATLTSAASTLTAQVGVIGLTQNALTAATASHASFKAVLTTQLSGFTDVDMASTISRLQAVGSQLQASYNVLSISRNLNLASYLQGG